MHNDAANSGKFIDFASRSPHPWETVPLCIYTSKYDIYNLTIPYKLQNGCEDVILATSTTHRDIMCMDQDIQMPHKSVRNSSIQKRHEKKDSFNFMYQSRD